MTLSDTLTMTSAMVSAIGVSVAAYSITLSQRESKKSRDVQTALQLFEIFRSNWIGSWGEAFDAVRIAQKEAAQRQVSTFDVSPTYRAQFFRMINWLDGIGRLIERKGITDSKLVFGTFEYQIIQVLEVSRLIIARGGDNKETNYWGGLIAFANCYHVNLAPSGSPDAAPQLTV